MNEFKKSLIVEREISGKIVITESLKNLLIELMKGNISKKQLMSITGIGDKHTVELKIEDIVAENPKLKPLYDDYIARRSADFNGYNFRAESIDMLRKDYSQSIMAEKIGVKRRTFSTKITKLKEENKDNILGILLKKHAERKMKRQKIEPEELIIINLELDKYEEEFPVGLARYEKRKPIEVRLENISKTLDAVNKLREDGYTIKQLSEKGIISESNYRKYKREAESLSAIIKGKSKEE